MPSFLEVCQRAMTGPSMNEQSFNLDVVFPTARKLCEKYNVVYDPENPVPADDDLSYRVYQAAIDFFCDVGVYCTGTHRVIKFTREEVSEAVTNARGECLMGEGKDRYVFTPRKPDSALKPWQHVGTGIVNTDERIAFNLVKAYAGIAEANSVSVPALESIDGQKVLSGTPSEIYGAIRAVKIARDALRDAGRPGLAIANCISAAGTSFATVAASAPQFGLRPSDGWLLGGLAEMKVDLGILNKAAYLLSWDANLSGESGPLVGGYAGGPAGAAIVNVAYMFMGLLVFNCRYHLTFPIHIMKGCSTTRDVLWCVAVSSQATSRNTREPVLNLGYIAAGPMTKQFYYESAAYIATAISSGVSTQTTHPARAVLNDYVTPMEMLGAVELAEGCTGMKRADANEIAKELLARYEDTIDDAPTGKKYQECYDVGTGEPCQEYVDLYGEVKKELRSLGIAYKQ